MFYVFFFFSNYLISLAKIIKIRKKKKEDITVFLILTCEWYLARIFNFLPILILKKNFKFIDKKLINRIDYSAFMRANIAYFLYLV